MGDFRIGVMGAGGRMGRELLRAIASVPGAVIAAGVERAGSVDIGADLGVLAGGAPLGIVVGGDPTALVAAVDVILDFTTPAVSVATAALAAAAGVAHVIGTTGCSVADDATIARAAKRCAILKSGNFSLGITLLVALTERIAATLDEDFDIEIVEAHHRRKVDAPSGTALMLGEAAARGRRVSLADVGVRARDGVTGERRRGDIGLQALRGGDVIGDHTVHFLAHGERLEITHRATDRAVFARGAVKAALWLVGKPAGLYSMADMIAL